jgi:drug/metabolite transporter (DMT)-like permease
LSLIAIESLSRIPLPDFYGIIFLSPFLVAILAHLLLHEEIGWHRMIAIAAGFVGVLVLAQPQFHDPNPGYLFAFALVFFIAAHVMIVRQLAGRDPLPLLTFYPALGIFVMGAILTFLHPVALHTTNLPLMLLYALAVLCGQLLFALAFSRTPLTAIIAPFVYTQMLWGILYGYLIFNQVPHTSTLIGAGIVISAGLWMIVMERRVRRRKAPAAMIPIPQD